MTTDDRSCTDPLGAGRLRRRRPDLPPAADPVGRGPGAGRGGHRFRRSGALRCATEVPGAATVGELSELPALGVAGVTITTPTATHAALAHEALDLGLHVVVDKPFALTAADAQELVDHAERAGLVVTPYQNRRWDSDLLTLRRLVADGCARHGAPLHLPDRPVPAGQGQLARRDRRPGRRHAAGPRAAPGRPGAAPVRAGRAGARRAGTVRDGRRRGGRDRAAPPARRRGALDAGRRDGVRGARAAVPGERDGGRLPHRRVRRAGGAAQGRRARRPASGWAGASSRSRPGARLYDGERRPADAERARPVGHLLPGRRPRGRR